MWREVVGILGDAAASAALVDEMLERAGAGFCLVGPDGRVLAANRVWLRSTGLERDEVVGRDILALFPETRELAVALHARARAGEVVEVPRHHQTLAGRDTWWEGQVLGVDLPGGRGIVIVAVDVTARVAQEVAIRERAETEARAGIEAENTALLAALLENAPLGIGFWDRELRFRRLNAALAEMNGLPVEAHVGKRPSEALPGIEAIEEIEAVWREILETGKPHVDVEVSGSTPAAPGRLRYWRETWYPVKAGEEVIGVGAIIQEVTASKQAEQLRELLLGIVGHDIRGPLGVVSNCAELLAGARDPDVAWAVERIGSSVERMRQVVELLFDFTRASRGTLPIEPQLMDLDDLVRQIVLDARAEHPDRAVSYLSGGAAPGYWDGGRLAQVVGNLLDNAFVHGDPKRPVTLRLRPEEDGVVLEVENQGEPIPSEQVPHLFEPLRRGGRRPDSRGMGLGLFIAQEIVRAHEGHIDVRSDEAATVFRVALPTSKRPIRCESARSRRG